MRALQNSKMTEENPDFHGILFYLWEYALY